MTDRELLELAAKAAGIDVRWIAECQDYYEHRPHMLPGYWDKWNPLADDGDALRLAVKLGLLVDVWLHQKVCIASNQGEEIADAKEQFGNDPYAATRRAIVRAAAEIGKAHSAASIVKE
jgi:hypothetical protein